MESLAKRKTEQRKLKEARRKDQERRVAAKKGKKEGAGAASAATQDEGEESGAKMAVEDENDDIEWYRREVGEEPDLEEAAELRARTGASEKKFKGDKSKKRKSPSGEDDATAEVRPQPKRRKVKVIKPKQ